MVRPTARAFASFAAAVLLGLLTAPGTAPAQDTPAEVQKAASFALAQGDYVNAIPYLMQLVGWYADSDDTRIVAMMESIYFNLGICHFALGQFSESRTAFETYLKKYRNGARAYQAAVYVGDAYRFESNTKDALKAYKFALDTYQYGADWKADILAAMAKCHLAEERWVEAAPLLLEVYRIAPDFQRRNWAASLLAMSYLKDMNVEKVYDMMPFLLHPESFASRSVALNMAALEAGDNLFAEEHYRDALWVYRIVYPHDQLVLNCVQYKEKLEKKAQRLRKTPGMIRKLMLTQEEIGQVEQELKALEEVENYDSELGYRIARSYHETRRYREARDLFYYLYEEDIPDRAEECLYLGFTSATQIQPWNRALEMGREYMRVYEGGEYYDTVSLTCGQIYANLQDWPNVITVLTNALAVNPKHENVVECMFLIGYASFMEEKFADAVDWLTRMNTQYPGNDREPDGHYWTGMAYLFDKKYEEGRRFFDIVVQDFPDCPYVEDASFRSASCDFGLSLFEPSERKLLAFLDAYPDSRLAAEAHLMLGDIAGADGRARLAVKEYQRATSSPDLNIEQYNYASFRAGEILFDLEDYDGILAHFAVYTERARDGSNIPLALYWQGNTYWKKGEQERTLTFYRQAVEKYGAERAELGIDLIMDQWIEKLRDAPKPLAEQGWSQMRALLRSAQESKSYALVLRLQRMLLYDPSVSDADKERIMGILLNENSLPYASAAILELIVDEARRRDNRDLAVKAATRIVDDFTETDAALSARMVLAREASEQGDYETAIRHLTIVREVYASSGEAAEALMQLADIYFKLRKLDEADQAYNDVLGAKEWRSLWPAALYGRGEVARARRQFDKASAYFERIYVLYSAYPAWTAKAYIARAESLARLFEYHKAVETLKEMLANPDLSGRPEAAEARQLVDKYAQRTP